MSLDHRLVAVLAASILALPLGCSVESGSTDGASPGGEETPPVVEVTDSPRCLRAQRHETWRLQTQVQTLTQRVLSRPDEVSPTVLRPVSRSVSRITRTSQRECGGDPTALATLAWLIDQGSDSLGNGTFGKPELREIVEAFQTWARTVGTARDAVIIFHRDACVPLRQQFRATYEVRHRPEPGGVAWWVELVFVNESPYPVFVEHAGRIEATAVRPGGMTAKYQWGASSADFAEVAPGRTSRVRVWPAPLPDVFIHLLPGGGIRVYDVEAWGGTVTSCHIPVARARA